jgi:hypothetical protein
MCVSQIADAEPTVFIYILQQQLRAIESVLGPVLGYSEEIMSKRLFVRDTEGSTPYTTYLAYSTGMACRCIMWTTDGDRSSANGLAKWISSRSGCGRVGQMG